MNPKRCECESFHHEDACRCTAQRERVTVYGTFKICLTCYERGHMDLRFDTSPTCNPLPDGFDAF